MLDKLIEEWRSRKQFEKLQAHPVCGMVMDFLAMVLKDPSEPLSQITNESKGKIGNEIFADIVGKISQPNPVQAVRNQLAVYVLNTTQFGVLLTTPETSMFKGISGELRPRIPELAKINKDLKEFFHGLQESPTTPSEMVEDLYAIHCHRDLWMRTYNITRIALKDHHADKRKDWFRPFLISQSIFWEYAYRNELNMPSNIEADEGEGIPGFARHCLYGSWPEIIEAGHQHPRLVWETNWESKIRKPSPFAGIEL